jgi:hypothetical protein
MVLLLTLLCLISAFPDESLVITGFWVVMTFATLVMVLKKHLQLQNKLFSIFELY